MDDNRYQENAEDQHTLTRPGMVTSPHDASAMPLTLTEELQMRVQQRTGGDHTPSMLRENSDNGVVQHCSKPRPQQDKKSEQKNSGVDNELAQKLKKRRTIHEESEVQDKADTVIAHKVMAADSATTLQQTAISSTVCRPHIPIKPRRRNNSDQTPVQELQDAGQGLEKLSLAIADTKHLLNEGPVTIQAGSEAPIVQQTDTNPKVSDVWRSSITHPKPRKRNSVKRTAVELLDAKHAIEMQAVCSSLMKTPHIQQTDASPARSVTCGPPLKPRLKRFTSLYESGKKEEKNKTKERPKSMLLFGTEEEEHQLCEPKTSEKQSKAQPYENVLPLGYEATKQPITNTGNDESPTTGTRWHSDVAVETSTLTVQYQYTAEERLRQREAVHQQELEEREQGYKNKRKHLEDEYKGMIDEFKEWHEEKMSRSRETYQNKHDEQRRQLTENFNKALAVQSAEAQAEKARLLTSADQTRLEHQKQLVELQQEKEADILLLADKEASLQHHQNENKRLNRQLEATNYKDELAPYILPHLPELGEQQGSGSYGSVYRIQLNGISCIAKRLHDILLGQGGEEGVNLDDKRALYVKFYHECVLLSRIRHPNIVQFMGVYYGPQRDYGRELTLVMERMYTNLEDCLKQYSNIEMWLKVSILLDVSQGLLYLHSRGVVHRDLTAANILLTTSFHAKIADLGVSRIINVHPLAASKQSMNPGTLGYMPPEALTEIPKYGSALDVFSFGVLILFVLLQEYPQFYDSYVTPEGLARKESHIQKRSKWINMLPSDDPFVQLICDCLQDVPERRPTTNNLNYMLIQIAAMHPKPYQDIIDMQKRLQL
ncbi:uncharacterized protein LOC135335026 isoform X2 [Halichondria panicea]|uniref:uncharacterized protein LOC135335026 isoform X2 n=1 Tax=Halichondria panicea TaxID=6063 RepID=UPI00312BAF6F